MTLSAIENESKIESNPPEVRTEFQSGRLSARWVESMSELESLNQGWEALCRNAIWQSPSYAPFFLIPALKHLSNGQVRILVIEQVNEKESQLVGLIPLISKKIYRMPVSAMEIWRHEQCFDATPLIHKNRPEEILITAIQFLANDRIGLLSLDTVSNEPVFSDVISNVSRRTNLLTFVRSHYDRAAFVPSENTESYLKEHASKNARKKNRQNQRKLSEIGELEFEVVKNGDSLEFLIEKFLQLESSGWKGEQKTALASHSHTENFFRDLVRQANERGALRISTLRVDGMPISMLCDFQLDQSVYCYKTAYDPEFSAYSPGVQIEYQNIDQYHADGIKWADSATSSDNATLNRIWGHRVRFQNLVLALRPGPASWAVCSMPWIQAMANRFRKSSH